MNPEYLSKSKVILPLSYLPPVDQYCFIVSTCNVLFEVNETFPKQTFRNRAIIHTANGILRLTVPVIKPSGNRTKTFEVLIDNKTAWNKIHWKAISSAYNNSPYFLYYKDEFEELLLKAEGPLADFNLKLINLVNKFLKVKPVIQFTTDFIKEYMDGHIDKRDYPKDFGLPYHSLKPYTQVFSEKLPFVPNLSIIDLLFNEGPHSIQYLKQATIQDTLS